MLQIGRFARIGKLRGSHSSYPEGFAQRYGHQLGVALKRMLQMRDGNIFHSDTPTEEGHQAVEAVEGADEGQETRRQRPGLLVDIHDVLVIAPSSLSLRTLLVLLPGPM